MHTKSRNTYWKVKIAGPDSSQKRSEWHWLHIRFIHPSNIHHSIHPYLDTFNEDSQIILPIMIMKGMSSSNIRLFLLQLKYAVCKNMFLHLHCTVDHWTMRSEGWLYCVCVFTWNRAWIRNLLHISTSYDHSTPSSEVVTFPNSNMTMETQPFEDVSPIEHGDFLMLVFGGVFPSCQQLKQPVASVVPVMGAIAILAKFCMVMAIMFNLLAERSHRFT